MLSNWIGAIRFSLAAFAELPHPDIIKLIHDGINQMWICGDNARLKIACVRAFYTQSCPRKVGRTCISQFAVYHNVFKVYSRT